MEEAPGSLPARMWAGMTSSLRWNDARGFFSVDGGRVTLVGTRRRSRRRGRRRKKSERGTNKAGAWLVSQSTSVTDDTRLLKRLVVIRSVRPTNHRPI